MNDEDIKLLKSIVKVHNTFLKGCKKETITEREIQAIENLLKENKQLEKTITRKMNNNKKIARKYLSERYRNKQLELDEKEKEVVEAYRNIKKITGSDSWIVCNPVTMWSEYFVPVAKIKEKIEELNKEEKELQNSISAEEYAEYSDANISFDLMHIEIQRRVLQELLEGK